MLTNVEQLSQLFTNQEGFTGNSAGERKGQLFCIAELLVDRPLAHQHAHKRGHGTFYFPVFDCTDWARLSPVLSMGVRQHENQRHVHRKVDQA